VKPVPKPKKSTPRASQVKRLDTAFSLYIRQRDGYRCVTCGSMERKKMQCGHLFSRLSYSTRWDERNAFCQCAGCNLRHEYDPGPLTLYYLSQYSKEDYEKLYKKHKTCEKFSASDLAELSRYYESRVK